MPRIILCFLLFMPIGTCLAQETVNIVNKTPYGIVEKYNALKTDNSIKQGLYQAFYKKVVIASGGYTNNVKTGIWHFYDPKGKVNQNFDYTHKLLLYVPSENDTLVQIRYSVDKKITAKDTATKPIKIGGTFYGYLPYTQFFKVESDRYNLNNLYGVLQLLVSPAGRLAECKLLVKRKIADDLVDSYKLDTELLTEDSKLFFPAHFNGEAILSTIYIFCDILPNGRISIY